MRAKVLEVFHEALEGGGDLGPLPGSDEELVDLPGMFRIAFCSPDPLTGLEAETAVAIVQRTLDSVLGPAGYDGEGTKLP